LTFVKLGEEARVDLTAFTLAGGKAASCVKSSGGSKKKERRSGSSHHATFPA
jgi:lysylphosphatidylglycerol synthetase-like protein (DUF2156 family)